MNELVESGISSLDDPGFQSCKAVINEAYHADFHTGISPRDGVCCPVTHVLPMISFLSRTETLRKGQHAPPDALVINNPIISSLLLNNAINNMINRIIDLCIRILLCPTSAPTI